MTEDLIAAATADALQLLQEIPHYLQELRGILKAPSLLALVL